ncbi:hypothetical protein ACKKBF_B15005 [Auxenochlorella protothecoides x Auxenochlorella symbiontica]
MAVAISGYLAFGDTVAGSVLAEPAIGPVWVIVLGNIMVFIHMLCAVQLLSQPVYAAMESAFAQRSRRARASPLAVRIVWRSLYTLLLTFVACLVPFFADVVGLVGALFYWPTVVVFPVVMWLAVYPAPWVKRWAMQGLNAGVLVVCLVAAVGAMSSIVRNASTYGLFH